MESYDSLIKTGELLGDKRRLKMLTALVDGQSWPAGDLAQHAGIQASTASYHLEQLVAGGLLVMVRQGRHRYYRLASPTVAEMIETLAALSPMEPTRSLIGSSQRTALRLGRTCYDHLAGQLGVAWMRAWLTTQRATATTTGCMLTKTGADWLAHIDLKISPGTHISYHAIDWTERVPHWSGPIAKEVTRQLFAFGWIERGSIARSVLVTPLGRKELHALGLSPEVVGTPPQPLATEGGAKPNA